MENEELRALAEQQKRRAESNRPFVERFVARLEEIREVNHFEENIRKVFQG